MNIDQNGSQDFARLVELQQQFTRKSNELGKLEVTMNEKSAEAAEALAANYVVLQEEVGTLEASIKAIFEKYPEWRGEKKSINTPYGEVEKRTVTKLECENPALTVSLIEMRGELDAHFKPMDHLHIEKSPNLEALEKYDDATLLSLGVKRTKSERINVKPAKVSVAKVVKAAKQPGKILTALPGRIEQTNP